MASINVRKESGQLYLDFRYRGVRCREQTLLPDTPANRKRLETLADKVQRAINEGTFSYPLFFPDSPRAKAFGNAETAIAMPSAASAGEQPVASSPTFEAFSAVWFSEGEPRWRLRYQRMIRDRLDRVLLPRFGQRPLAEITRADVLAFRADLAKRPGRGGALLSAKTINKWMLLLGAILNEGCDRHGLTSPSRGIKPLKQKRTEIHPFTLTEVEALIQTVRADFRPYLVLRLQTGLRTGEADGLQWEDIDFSQGTITVRRTQSRDGDGDLKTEASFRTIPMFPRVREALQTQQALRAPDATWVFTSARGNPVDAVNFTNRVWYPLLRHLGLKRRPPYQMRHTAATLMLASGENPEWVASILGHTTTEMLFRVYSRFVPNLTRNDGRAFVGLLSGHMNAPSRTTQPNADASALLSQLSPADKAKLMAALAGELASQGERRD